MEKLFIKPTEDSPLISFCNTSKKLEISGRSIPEDANGFYLPVLDWIKKIKDSVPSGYEFLINLEYFNTSTSKILLDILTFCEQYHYSGLSTFEITWNYDKCDTNMLETAEEFSDIIELPFNINAIEYKEMMSRLI